MPPESAAVPRRALAALIVTQIGLHACMTGVRMAAPLYVLKTGFPPGVAGALVALFSLAPVGLAVPAGRLADRHGYHRPVRLGVLASTLGAALSALGVLLASRAGLAGLGLVLLALGAVCCGAGAHVGLIAVQRSGGRLASDRTAIKKVYSWLGLAPSLSNVTGPMIAGVLIDHLGFAWAFAGLGLLPLWALAWSFRVPREVPARVARPPGESTRDRVLGLLRQPMMRRLLLVNWALSASWDLHALLVPVLGHDRALSASAIGGILAAFATAVASVRLFLPRVVEHLAEAPTLRFAMLWTAGVFVLYPFASTGWTMAACAVLLGLALGVVQPMVMSTLHHISPPDRHGEAIAVRSMTINISSTLMPVMFGFASAAAGVSLVFWTMAGMVLLASRATRGLAGAEHT